MLFLGVSIGGSLEEMSIGIGQLSKKTPISSGDGYRPAWVSIVRLPRALTEPDGRGRRNVLVDKLGHLPSLVLRR